VALDAALAARQEEIVSEMVQAMGAPLARSHSDYAAQLLEGCASELKGGSPGLFLRGLDKALSQTRAAGGDVEVWQNVLSILRRRLLPHLDGPGLAVADDLWHQGRVMIGQAAKRVQAHQALQAEQRAATLREIGQSLITTFDVQGAMDVLAADLPRLGIRSCYLSLYEEPQPSSKWSWLILAYNENGRVELEPEGRRFLSRRLAPEGVLPQRRYSLVAEQLYFREGQFGFVLFEVGPREGTVYDVLRGEISSALRGALLLREREQAEEALEKAYAEVERQVEQRTTELQREIEERERAQEESVRLQQEVIEAQQRAIQELSTPIIPVLELPQGGSVIVMPLIGSIDTLRARDVTRSLLAGIREHHAKVVILDITGVPIVDSGVAAYLNKTIQAARLKGARTIVTGISDAVAETIVDLGIDWSGIETLSDLQTGLRAVVAGLRKA
jgi:anti-anti-sigma regulatory factor